jgi:heparan-alpha-glucosaminide N-acetyltransferase
MQAAERTAKLARPVPPEAALTRNTAVDAYRGFVMILMMAEVLSLPQVAKSIPGSSFWSFLAFNQSHVAWAGCSLHDTIQPGFSFLVGVALPYSIASRMAKGGTFGRMFGHALWRSLVLIALGIFLRSMNHSQTYFTFEDTLTQIGLGYPFLFLLGFRPPRWAWIALGAILFGYWLAWALYPVGPELDHFSGFAAHWNQSSNLGNAFDQWFLNLFPRERPFVANRGGYVTLSFVPTLGTMILGLVAGRWLRDGVPVRRLLIAGAAGIAAGALLHFTGICPIVKRIWTPGWTLFSGGICFLFLAGFWMLGKRKWLFPLIVVGTNSIAAYLIAHLFERFLYDSLKIHLGPRPFQVFGTALAPLVTGAAVLAMYWLVLFWMYRRKIFLRV